MVQKPTHTHTHTNTHTQTYTHTNTHTHTHTHKYTHTYVRVHKNTLLHLTHIKTSEPTHHSHPPLALVQA